MQLNKLLEIQKLMYLKKKKIKTFIFHKNNFYIDKFKV